MCVDEFVSDAHGDMNSPTTSSFVSRIQHLRNYAVSLEEVRDSDRECVGKVRKAAKSISNSDHASYEAQLLYSKCMKELAEKRHCRPEVDEAFARFAAVSNELSVLTKSLNQSFNNTLLFPLDCMMKGDLKCARGDLKRPIDRAWKEYESKLIKIEKEKQRQAREAGMVRTDISVAELSEVMHRERRLLQINMCDYFIKINELNTKKEVDLLQHLMTYHQAQQTYFRSGLEVIDRLGGYVQDLSERMDSFRAGQDSDRKQLLELRARLQQSYAPDAKEPSASPRYSLHRDTGDKSKGYTRQGFLLKKSEGKVRKVWQKRRSEIRAGYLYIWHSDETKAPTTFNLLTCHVRPVSDDRRSFDLISFDRTYHLQAEDEHDRAGWIAVMANCKEGALQKVFSDSDHAGGREGHDRGAQGLRELQQTLVTLILQRPGNKQCADCMSENDVTWLSTNFGIVVCIECSGIHRELGVHISRIQSLTLDHVGTSQLLLTRVLGNTSFNDIAEATLSSEDKLKPNATMEQRCAFIRSKYVDWRFVMRSGLSQQQLLEMLEQAVSGRHIFQLVQVYAEGVELASPLPANTNAETALHLAIRNEVDTSSLHIVDFLVQNSSPSALSAVTLRGETPLHYCAIYNRTECMKLLLRSGVLHSPSTLAECTAFDLAARLDHTLCCDLIKCAECGNKAAFENVAVDLKSWCLPPPEEGSTDFSDEDVLTADEPSISNTGCSPASPSFSAVSVPNPNHNQDQRRRSRPLSSAGHHSSSHSFSSVGRQSLTHSFSSGGGVQQDVVGEHHRRRCRAMYDCQADNDDELTFTEGEVIVIVAESTEDAEWMEGYVENAPHRRGMLPVSFVYMLND